MTSDTWNPDQYARFRQERSQPFFDLLDLVRPEPAMRAIDLGCGTGELTQVLHERLHPAETIGLDNSDAMLARSAAFAGPGLRFEKGDIATFAPDRSFDLIFSNAALQWVPDHPAVFVRLLPALKAGGQLASQMPANHDHPSHVTAREVAAEEPFRSALTGYSRWSPILKPEEYAELLDRLGVSEQHVRLQIYGHHLGSREDVVEWVKGTLLTDYERRLTPDLFQQFLARYREVLMPRLADRRPFFYAFKRLLIWARR